MAFSIVPLSSNLSAKAAAADTSLIDGPKWNTTRSITGGVRGAALFYDDTQVSGLNGAVSSAAGSILAAPTTSGGTVFTNTPFISGQMICGSSTPGVNAAATSKVLGRTQNFTTTNATNFRIVDATYIEQQVATTGSAQGIEGYANTTHPSGTVALLIGTIGNVEHGSVSTLTEQRGVQAGVVISNSGNGTDAECFFAAPSGRIGSGTGTFTNGYGLRVGLFGSGFTNKFSVYSSDSTAKMFQAGAVQFSNFGAGTATFDGSGNISSVSDERLKTDIAALTYGLAEVRRLTPISFRFTEESGLDTAGTYAGFSAQDVQQALPLGVKANDAGYLSLDDRAIIGALVNAVKQLAARVDALENGAA
jgi:hypothetical protein